MKENPELVARILEDPADDDARLVYADWLMHDDDDKEASARGELIAVECAIDRCEREYLPVSRQLRERDVALRRRYEEKWKQPLRSYMGTGHFKRGFVETVTLPPYVEPAHRLQALRELTPVRWLSFDAHGVEGDFARQLGALGTSHVMKQIEGIRFPEGIDALPLLPRAAFVALAQLVHLKWLVLPDHRLGPRHLAGFAEAPFTRLEVLDLSCANGIEPRSVRALVESPALAGLKHLNVSSRSRDRARRADSIAELFAWATHLDRLERLTLPIGLTDEGVRHLTRAHHWVELKELRLEGPSLFRGYDVLANEAPEWLDGLLKLEIDRNGVGEPLTGVANASLARLLSSGRLKKLRHLAIAGDFDLTEDLGRAIVDRSSLPELRVLKLGARNLHFSDAVKAELTRLTDVG